jgi:hypothetical protein
MVIPVFQNFSKTPKQSVATFNFLPTGSEFSVTSAADGSNKVVLLNYHQYKYLFVFLLDQLAGQHISTKMWSSSGHFIT